MVEMVITSLNMRTIVITQEERRMATRPNVYLNRKKYTRKSKHNNFNKTLTKF
jgi:hypothetical protein